ncbi:MULTISPECIES: GNAT family N-acetyltransferase [unclassified Streptomyces]|uniref:GNAT family N-acetyltransferase n=1 Tax=unclassified Streptomyces TaxID=2593676 RepID=UPI004043273D
MRPRRPNGAGPPIGSSCVRSRTARWTRPNSATGCGRRVWGRGYATEGSRGLLDKAFTQLGVRRAWATGSAGVGSDCPAAADRPEQRRHLHLRCLSRLRRPRRSGAWGSLPQGESGRLPRVCAPPLGWYADA